MIDLEGDAKIELFNHRRYIRKNSKDILVTGYDSPERLEKNTFDKMADVWALGCLIYELCTSKVCFIINYKNRRCMMEKLKRKF